MDQMVVPDSLKIYTGKKVLLTGDTGFKGAWLAFWLHKLGAQVMGVALKEEDSRLFYTLELAKRIKHVDLDIRDLESLEHVFSEFQPEFVFHLAAQALVRPSYDDPKTTFDTNVGGSVNVLECVRKTESVKSVIYVTTDKCYKNKEWIWGYRENDELGGHDPYSASKAAAEILFNSYQSSFFYKRDIGISSVRAGNVIGGGDWSEDRIIPDCMRALKNNQAIPVRNKVATRPWQHVLDPLYGYMLLGAKQYLDKSLSGNWNFGPDANANKRVEELVHEVVKAWGAGEVKDASDPNAVHEAGLLQLNCDKAKFQLAWNPIWDFEKATFYTVDWYKRVINNEDIESVTLGQIEEFMKDLA